MAVVPAMLAPLFVTVKIASPFTQAPLTLMLEQSQESGPCWTQLGAVGVGVRVFVAVGVSLGVCVGVLVAVAVYVLVGEDVSVLVGVEV